MPSLDLSIDNKIRKDTGAHYTPVSLSDFVAKKILDDFQTRHPDKKELKILDPAVGDGELLDSILRLSGKRGFLSISVTGFDINKDAVDAAKSLLKKYKGTASVELFHEDFLDWVIESGKNDLFTKSKQKYFDIVIANPPYVRTQVLGSDKANQLAEQFSLSGRVDLYHAFLVAIERILEPDGTVGIIVSNRFLTTKSGESVRIHLSDNFNISQIWDFGDTRLFKAAVLPAVLLMSKKDVSWEHPTGFTSIYLNETNCVKPDDIFSALENNETNDFLKITRGTLGKKLNPKEVWFISNEESDSWLNQVNQNTKLLFSDIGKVRVGVKTTADKVFIVSNEQEFEHGVPENLRPLITHHVAKRYKADSPIKKIIYTHEDSGGKKSPINLDEYPNTKKYLESHFTTLDDRTYVKKSNRNWYEIWVPHNPSDWDKPKLVFRDISEQPVFWLEKESSIVNGDCYWLAPSSAETEELLWLALAVANSKFIEEFYDKKFNNKLYSGRRRFITQYVEKFPLPDPESSTVSEMVSIVKRLYSNPNKNDLERQEKRINELVYKSFGL